MGSRDRMPACDWSAAHLAVVSGAPVPESTSSTWDTWPPGPCTAATTRAPGQYYDHMANVLKIFKQNIIVKCRQNNKTKTFLRQSTLSTTTNSEFLFANIIPHR